jgi:hypothetical protein
MLVKDSDFVVDLVFKDVRVGSTPMFGFSGMLVLKRGNKVFGSLGKVFLASDAVIIRVDTKRVVNLLSKKVAWGASFSEIERFVGHQVSCELKDAVFKVLSFKD